MTSPLLAALMTPALLYAGLAAAAIPIIIHLLSKRRFRKVRWAAIDWLLEADRQNRRRVRLEELILLAMRCLAMFIIGAMLARVFLRPQTLMAMLGSAARTERIIVLDDSYSMGARTGGESRSEGTARQATVFDRAKSATDRLVRWLRQETPGDPVTIVLTSRPDRPLHTETSVGKIDVAGWGAELDALAPSARGGNFPATFSAIRGSLEGRKSGNAAVYVVSDFQRVDWAAGKAAGGALADLPKPRLGKGGISDAAAGSSNAASPLTTLGEWAGGGKHNVRVILMDVGAASRPNLTLAAIEPQQAQAIAGVAGNYIAKIINNGDTDSAATSMQVFVGDAAQPALAVPAIPARQSAEVPFEVTFPNEGAETLTLELEPDALPADNTRSLVVPVARAMRVLIVNGEPATDPYQDEAYLLTVALRPEGPQFSGNDVTVVDENEFEATDLANFHVVVLANVHRVTEETATRLEEYAAAGGGVMIFLGDQVEPDLYNRTLYRDGKGLLPGKLGEVISPPQDKPGVAFGEIDVAHPAMRRFRDTQAPLFAGVLAYRYIAVEPVSSTQPADTRPASHGAATSQKAETRGPAQVLMRLADAERTPVLLERSFGAGRVAMMTTSADKEWTNLPDRPVYVVLAMELIQYLARPAGDGGEQIVGSPIKLRLDPGRYRTAATLKLPSFPQEPEIHLEAQVEAEAGGPVLAWTRTDQPGVYRFTLLDTAGAESVRPVAINVDPREGDLHHADREALVAPVGGVPVEYVAGDALIEQDANSRRELWPALLVILVGLLMSEQALAWWFGGDRQMVALWKRN